MVIILCKKCGHSWEYKGDSQFYVTCPMCYRKIRRLDIIQEEGGEKDVR